MIENGWLYHCKIFILQCMHGGKEVLLCQMTCGVNCHSIIHSHLSRAPRREKRGGACFVFHFLEKLKFLVFCLFGYSRITKNNRANIFVLSYFMIDGEFKQVDEKKY